jgi:glutamate racemase
MSNDKPIGIFDSGVGGLSVLVHVRALLPCENVLYVADSGHVPYGNKAPQYIRARSFAIVEFLRARGAKAVVIACNTATAAAAAPLRATFTLPIVGMEPAVKPAVAATRTGVIGVLATEGTVKSGRYAALLERYGPGVEIITQPCVGLVEQVEQGALADDNTRQLLRYYTAPLLQRGADVLVLGCTHYPFLRPLLQDVVGTRIAIIDTGAAVARQLRERLLAAELLRGGDAPGGEEFWTSGDPTLTLRVVRRLWNGGAAVAALPEAYCRVSTLDGEL